MEHGQRRAEDQKNMHTNSQYTGFLFDPQKMEKCRLPDEEGADGSAAKGQAHPGPQGPPAEENQSNPRQSDNLSAEQSRLDARRHHGPRMADKLYRELLEPTVADEETLESAEPYAADFLERIATGDPVVDVLGVALLCTQARYAGLSLKASRETDPDMQMVLHRGADRTGNLMLRTARTLQELRGPRGSVETYFEMRQDHLARRRSLRTQVLAMESNEQPNYKPEADGPGRETNLHADGSRPGGSSGGRQAEDALGPEHRPQEPGGEGAR
jgi:hypothetical protein